MHVYLRVFVISLLSVFVLVGCRGDSPYEKDQETTTPDDGGGDDGDGGDDSSGTANSGVSYLPLNVYEADMNYSGASQDNVFRGELWTDPVGVDAFIPAYLINPVDAATLSAVNTAVASDYKITVDGIDIDSSESFPLLQKVIGNETQLVTALVFDLSNSINAVNMPALIAEAKAYITAVQASTDPTIRNQQFVVWAFAQEVDEQTNGFTSDAPTINNALDQVQAIYDSGALGTGSNLHRAVVEAIGRYVEDPYNYRDPEIGPYNDLVDVSISDYTQMSQLVIFSSGPDTALEFDSAEMQNAIQSQSFLKYDSTAAAGQTSMVNLYKPVFYYVVGGNSSGTAYTNLSTLAESTTNLVVSGGAYSFSADLISKQQAAIDRRIDLDNLYLFRFAMIPRTGDHTAIFASNSTGNNYSLTTDYSEEFITGRYGSTESPEAELSTLVEITGPSGEYISGNDLLLTEASTFAPVTRWTNSTFGASDYAWAIANGTGSTNADGTFTVTGVTGTATLTLTNSVLSDSVSIEISN